METKIHLQFLNEPNFRYLCQGLTLNERDMEVIDQVLAKLNDQDGLINTIITQNQHEGLESTLQTIGPQIIVSFDKYDVSGKPLTPAAVLKSNNCNDLPPMLHINLHSPTLNIPQRIEIPLRYTLKGAAPLKGTYMVYLHALQINDDKTFVYYGITKRGWMKRFNEHVRLAVKGKSQRKFPKLFGESIKARIYELFNGSHLGDNILTGSYHVVCAAGRTQKNACEIEKYLIDKRSLSATEGLNMISGHQVSKGNIQDEI
ncbi:hypothetical protein [Sphingobacterium psychroaquaticum]|uniref:Uncharacterized protein n=1 Tax=Sphingobacterium psychroaquaticum TaxID=561061 RepID=A0A1X7LCQ5_9SPHI|nr:hypothetical protein [Sphingobacterium psychroaquaticum]SMG51638.1 hypothetical protein SAMN05660862_0007 [Sphingobacterium psychroaquaticum]